MSEKIKEQYGGGKEGTYSFIASIAHTQNKILFRKYRKVAGGQWLKKMVQKVYYIGLSCHDTISLKKDMVIGFYKINKGS